MRIIEEGGRERWREEEVEGGREGREYGIEGRTEKGKEGYS